MTQQKDFCLIAKTAAKGYTSVYKCKMSWSAYHYTVFDTVGIFRILKGSPKICRRKEAMFRFSEVTLVANLLTLPGGRSQDCVVSES